MLKAIQVLLFPGQKMYHCAHACPADRDCSANGPAGSRTPGSCLLYLQGTARPGKETRACGHCPAQAALLPG